MTDRFLGTNSQVYQNRWRGVQKLWFNFALLVSLVQRWSEAQLHTCTVIPQPANKLLIHLKRLMYEHNDLQLRL